jgi:hypothetical protein
MKCIATVVILSLAVVLAAVPVMAQQPANHATTANPLVQLLQAKGILTPEEASSVNQASSAEDANARLAQLLVSKGLISDQDYKNTFGAPASSAPVPTLTATTSSPHVMDAVYHMPLVKAEAPPAALPPHAKPETTSLPPGIAPLRVLPIDLPKQGGLIPDIKLGSGANMKLYGFFKASAVEDTASSGGATFGSNDFPLPLLIGGDTGPTSDPQFHIKDRSFRIGSQFEWVPKNQNVTLTGKIEADFEGDYTNVNNRNIGAMRASMFSIRLAYIRLDKKLGDKLPWFVQFGQDWSLISSSLPSLFETTGVGIGMGTLWERQPMFKTGVQFKTGDLQIQPEFAITLPVAGTASLTDEERARFGDRAGAESNRPGLQSRLVFQFPLHHWAGVVPAQIIFSGSHAQINEIIPGTALTATSAAGTPGLPNTLIPGAAGCADPLLTGGCSIHGFFPRGIENRYPQNVWTAEVQLPTPWVTFVAKYFQGDDMRFFFAGQLNDVFSNLRGTGEVGAGTSFSGRAITFGCPGATGSAELGTFSCNGNGIIAAKLQPIGGYGGFGELSFPLSRIFHANAEGNNSGWVLHFTYATDRANAADVRHGNGLARTDLDTGSITYKLNKWVTFVNETSYIVTRAATANSKLFEGLHVTQAHNWRNEFGPVFVF